VFRFLLTRRWLGLLLAVIVLGVGCVELGRWQFWRYSTRQESNNSIRANIARPPVPVEQVMSPTQPVSDSAEWTNVTATGTYDPSHQVFVIYRTRDSTAGVDVVVPLITASGTALLVDRGWVQSAANANETPNAPAPPTGKVTVTGWVRKNSTGGPDQVVPSGGSVRAISSDALKADLPYPVYDGFLDRTKEVPETTVSPAPALAPDLSRGPSFFYGMQWWFFAILAFGFWFYFAWSEYKEQQSSQRPGKPPVDREHRAGDVTSGR
jgi:cytochrome oxidase assembly protein ShyY1